MEQDEISPQDIIEMARQAGFLINELHCSPPILSFVGQEESMQAFAKLVDAKATAKATEEANARANASWTLMCKKMVEAEREACAKVCSRLADEALVVGDEDAVMCFEEAENTIRARGEPTSRGEA